MPIATPEKYAEMLDRAKDNAYAFPAINVTSSQTLSAALRGFAEAESDGIIQVSTGGAEFWSGATIGVSKYFLDNLDGEELLLGTTPKARG